MNAGDRENLEQRVLVLAPTSKDAILTQDVLGRAGVKSACYSDLGHLCQGLTAGAGAVLIPEEATTSDQSGRLIEWLAQQPPWSDLPILVLVRSGADSTVVSHAMDQLGNITVLERPIRVAAIGRAVRTALRARERQYQIRDYIRDNERHTRAQALLAAIVASLEYAIISKSLEGMILTWNTGAERLFGYPASEAIGRSILMLIPPERQNEETEIIDRLRRGELIEHFETVRVAKNGRRIDLSLTVSPIRGVDGKIIGASKVARDITQRKQTEAALRDADRRKDEFLAVLAHELRNPLAPIRNSLHILRMGSPRDSATDRVSEMMERQVNHMVRLVDDLLEVSRITRGKIDLRKEHVEVAAIVRGAVETSRPLIEAAGHRLAISIPGETLMLDGDPVRLNQVIANLLNNAAKYMDSGGQIWLTARREGDSIAISIRDTGNGIPPAMLPRVFDLFMQIDRLTERGQGGLGIGLTLVKSLVELHGGSVVAFSDGKGRGSEFVVRLPLITAPSPDNSQKAIPRTSPVLTQRRVLVVDDNRDAAESLGMLLDLLGADVHYVFNGPEALKAVATYRPDVVILDIGMPGMDGHEVARRLRQQPEFRNITLIALTGWGQEDDRRRSRDSGFDYHLTKPAELGVLQKLLVPQETSLT